jgi:hypothetical protein
LMFFLNDNTADTAKPPQEWPSRNKGKSAKIGLFWM